jgi:hypothetical protein
MEISSLEKLFGRTTITSINVETTSNGLSISNFNCSTLKLTICNKRDGMCSVCLLETDSLNEQRNRLYLTNCRHQICKVCTFELINTRFDQNKDVICPICRTILLEIFKVYDWTKQ